MAAPKVYLAGPDVFYPLATKRFSVIKAALAKLGLEGVSPLDNVIQHPDKYKLGVLIYQANEKLVRDCDAVLANLRPFRGPSMDLGTGFELGLARGLGKPLFGYNAPATEYKARCEVVPNSDRDPEGMLVEDFGMFDNLMVVAPTEAYDTFYEASEAVRKYFFPR